MPTTDYTEFLHNVKQEYITNSYELDGIFIFDIELPATSHICLLYTSPSPRDRSLSRMPSSA